MIVMRLFQGVGGAFLMANSTAILTDAFPEDQRGLALGTNTVAGIAGSFIGLVLGGVLGPIDWRLVFLVSVPVGVVGTIWGVRQSEGEGHPHPGQDRLGRQRHLRRRPGIAAGRDRLRHRALRRPPMGWTNPFVLAALIGGVAMLVLFVWIETKVEAPMFRIPLFRIRAFAAGQRGQLLGLARTGRPHVHPRHLAPGDLAAPPRLQLRRTPLWAGHLHAAAHRRLPCRRARSRGSCRTASGRGPSPPAACCWRRSSFGLLELLPINFSYIWFALLLLLNGVAMGHVLLAQPGRDHERPSARPSGARGRAWSPPRRTRPWCSRSASSSP